MAFPALPNELYYAIVQHADMPTLYSLSLSSRFFSEEAIRVLYRVMDNIKPDVQIGFLRTMISSPRLASLVHTYSNVGGFSLLKDDQAETFLSLLPRALENMVGLKHLMTWTGLDPDLSQSPAAYSFSLQSIKYTSTTSQDLLIHFLHTQPSLKHIGVPWVGLNDVDPSDPEFACCRSLESVHGNWPVLRALLPGRRIQCATWEEDSYNEGKSGAIFDLRGQEDLKDALGGLKAMKLKFSSWKPDFLPLLIESLSSVETLEIDLSRGDFNVSKRLLAVSYS